MQTANSLSRLRTVCLTDPEPDMEMLSSAMRSNGSMFMCPAVHTFITELAPYSIDPKDKFVTGNSKNGYSDSKHVILPGNLTQGECPVFNLQSSAFSLQPSVFSLQSSWLTLISWH